MEPKQRVYFISTKPHVIGSVFNYGTYCPALGFCGKLIKNYYRKEKALLLCQMLISHM